MMSIIFRSDKKVARGELRLVLLRGALGHAELCGEVDPAALRAVLASHCSASAPT